VSTEDGRITLEFGAGAFSEDAEVLIEYIACGEAPEGFRIGDTCFRITVTVDGEEATELDADLTICIEYSTADLAAADCDPALLAIAYFDEDTGEWRDLPTIVYVHGGIICAAANHVSDWAVLADGEEEAGGWQWWYTLLIVVGIIAVVGVVVVLFLRGGRRRPAKGLEDYELEEMP